MINRMKTLISALALRWLHKIHRTPQIAKIEGKRFYICPGVFNPVWTLTGRFLAKNLLVQEGDFVLDLGTGSGILAVFAAEKSKRVIATDINPIAVRCARINARLNNLTHKIAVKEGDLFEPIEGEKFDLILFSPPYLPSKPRSMLERAWSDVNHNLVRRFFREVKRYLKPNGRIQMVYSTLGDIHRLKKLIGLACFRARTVAEKHTIFERIFIYELKDEGEGLNPIP